MKTIWKVIDVDGRLLEVELSGELYGGEFRVKEVIVVSADWEAGLEDGDFDFVVDSLVDKNSYIFEIFNEIIVNEGNGDVLDVSLL